MLMDSVGQEFGQGPVEMTCLCPVISGASAGEATIWGDLTAGPRIFYRQLDSPVWLLCFDDLGLLVSVEAANHSTCSCPSLVTWASSQPGSFRVVGLQHRGSGFQKLRSLQTKHELHCLVGPIIKSQTPSLLLYSPGWTRHKAAQIQGRKDKASIF